MSARSEKLELVQFCVVCFLVSSEVCRGEVSELSYDYYKNSCPGLEAIVKHSLLPIFIADLRSPAALLRLVFNDCQVQGCDASILLHSDPSLEISSEMLSSKNFGIRNRESIAKIKTIVEAFCPGQVSCADIIALAARDAITYSGGPHIPIPLGRKDAMTASNLHADAELPLPSLGVSGAMKFFTEKGMSVEEMVAILGAHTIGSGHCLSIFHRLSNSNNNKHKDQIIKGSFEAYLRFKCPTDQLPISNYTFVTNDLTPVMFDNQYYRDVMSGRGLFTVDSDLLTDSQTVRIVGEFEENQGYFFQMFSSAFVKLLSTVNRDGGQVRRHGNRVN